MKRRDSGGRDRASRALSTRLRWSLLVLLSAAAVAAAGLPAAAQASPTSTVTLTNWGSQPLFFFASYTGIESGGTGDYQSTIQPGASATLVTTFVGTFYESELIVYRYGNSLTFLGVMTQFGGGNSGDIGCGWTDANAGFDGETVNPWSTDGCEETQQQTGSTTIVGSVTAFNPVVDVQPSPCTNRPSQWNTASATGVQVNVDNATDQTLNLITGQLPNTAGSEDDGGDGDPGEDLRARLSQVNLGPGPNSLATNSWQFPPSQQIYAGDDSFNFCSYDLTSAIGGSSTGSYPVAIYQIGTSDEYLTVSPQIPIFGANSFACEVTDLNGDSIADPAYATDCGIDEDGGIGTWHAVSWLTVWNTGADASAAKPARAWDAPAPPLSTTASRPAAARTPPSRPAPARTAAARIPRGAVAVVERRPIPLALYRHWRAVLTKAGGTSDFVRLATGDASYAACLRSLVRHGGSGADVRARSRRFCARTRAVASSNRKRINEDAMRIVVQHRWLRRAAQRRGVDASSRRIQRGVASIRRRLDGAYRPLTRRLGMTHADMRRLVEANLLAGRLGLGGTQTIDAAMAFNDRWKARTFCRARRAVERLCR
jgi:hypothetical protein